MTTAETIQSLLAPGLHIRIPGNRERAGMTGKIVKVSRAFITIAYEYFEQPCELKWRKDDLTGALLASPLHAA
jgi:hypothetical protein